MNITEIRELNEAKQKLEIQITELLAWFDLTTSPTNNGHERREGLLVGMARRQAKIEAIDLRLEELTASYPEAVTLLQAA